MTPPSPEPILGDAASSRVPPAAAPKRRRGFFRALPPWLLAIAAGAAGVWWAFHFPYDPQAIYRAIPARAAAVLHAPDLPARWEDLVANPIVASALRTGGTEPDDALWLVRDPETRAWFERLAGRDALLAWLPAQEGRAPALVAATWLGGDASWLRQELLLFKLPDFQRMVKAFPDRAVWRVKGLDLPRGWVLTLTFGDGVLLACLSPNPYGIGELLAAHDANAPRLLDAPLGFDAFASANNAAPPSPPPPLRLWIRDDWPAPTSPDILPIPDPLLPPPSPAADAPSATSGGSGTPPPPSGRILDILALDATRIDLRATARDLSDWLDPDPSPADYAPLGRLLRNTPCATLLLRRSLLRQSLRQTWLRGDARHGMRMALEIAGDPLAVALLDGDHSGRLAFGLMRKLGLSGLKVPTLLAATPAPDTAAAQAAVGRILDSCNARYRGAFVFRPKTLPDGTVLCTLESAGGNEWVDELAPADRPAWAIRDGWLLVASNRAALEKLLSAPSVPPSSPLPPWATSSTTPAARLWLDLDRTATTYAHLAAMWSMAQRFLGIPTDPALQRILDDIRAWLDAFRPYNQATAEWAPAPGSLSLFNLSTSPTPRP